MKLIKVSQKSKIASIILFNKKGEILVLQRSSKCENNPSKWNLPGGHIDKGETPKEAAIRECQEEAGITPKKVKFFGNYGEMAVFICKTKKTPTLNEESDDWKFISKKDIKKLDFTRNVVKVLNEVFSNI